MKLCYFNQSFFQSNIDKVNHLTFIINVVNLVFVLKAFNFRFYIKYLSHYFFQFITKIDSIIKLIWILISKLFNISF